jgi:glycosyltransferase involved in cell wall biosynthesis
LGKAIQERGHRVAVLRPRFDDVPVASPKVRVVEYEGMQVEEIPVPEAPSWASKAGLGKARREIVARSLMSRVALRRATEQGFQVLHGGHAISAVAASQAARQARARGLEVVSVATVRDYWPLCPVSTRLFFDSLGRPFECPECHRLAPYLGSVLRSYAGRSRRKPWLLVKALAGATARWSNTRRQAQLLADCNAVIAVSDYVRGELARSGRVPKDRLHTIPNLVDLPSVDAAIDGPWPLPDISQKSRFLLFAGKLDPNKGAQMLPELIRRSELNLPVVIAGDGPMRHRIESEAQRHGLDFRFYDWLENAAVIRLMSRCTALLFPSAWQEPLSRVLLEGLASGAAIVALNTGGTPDAIEHLKSGWLAPDMGSMIEGLRTIAGVPTFRRRLRTGARRQAEEHFAAPVVSAQVEELYRNLLSSEAAE